jgi:hypothetical protein
LAFDLFVDALQSLAFALRGRPLADVRARLPFVRRFFPIIGESVPLIGDAVSLIGGPLAPQELTLASRKCLRALVGLGIAAIGFIGLTGTALSDHISP